MIGRQNSDFSITRKLNEYIRNEEWKSGLQDVILDLLPKDAQGKVDLKRCPGYSSLWYTLSASYEDVGEMIYEKIANLVENIQDVDHCDIDSLRSICDFIGVEDVKLFNVRYPLEVKQFIETFSIPRDLVSTSGIVLSDNSYASLYSYTSAYASGYMDGYSTATSAGGDVWTEQQASFIEAAHAGNFVVNLDSLYIDYIENQISALLLEGLYSDGIIDDMWKRINVSQEDTVETVLETPEDDTVINAIKTANSVPLSFSANSAVDQISRGRASLFDYAANEQAVILAEANRRWKQEKFGDRPTSFRRFKLDRDRQVRDYITFIENVSYLSDETVTVGEQYDTISFTDRYRFFDTYSNGTPVSGDMVSNAVHFIRNSCFEMSYLRENLKAFVFKHQMIGSSQLIENDVLEYIKRKFSSANEWRMFSFPSLSGNSAIQLLNIGYDFLLSAFNSSDVRVVEYTDETEYFNLSTIVDNENTSVNPRFWIGGDLQAYIDSSEHIESEVSGFYSQFEGFESLSFEQISSFIAQVYSMAALSARLSGTDLSSSDWMSISASMYEALGPDLSAWAETNISGMAFKYIGAPSGEFSWANQKNAVHPTVAISPFIWNFREYINSRLNLENIYNAQSLDVQEAVTTLSTKIGTDGQSIDLWRKDNSTMIGYRDEYQYSPNFDQDLIVDERVDIDGPFYFEALSSYLEVGASNFVNLKFDDYYSHLDLTSSMEDKVKAQLVLHESDIQGLANQKIWQNCRDKYGNTYNLFKTDHEFDTSGTVWMRYKDHPIAFPITDDNADGNVQIDCETYLQDLDGALEALRSSYDIGTVGLNSVQLFWTYSRDSRGGFSQNGHIICFEVSNSENSNVNPFIAKRLRNNNYQIFYLDRNETFVGTFVARNDDVYSIVFVSLLSETKISDYSVQYTFVYRHYNVNDGWKSQNVTITAKLESKDTTDRNVWKLVTYRDFVSIFFEAKNGTIFDEMYTASQNRPFDGRFNEYKHLYNNAIVSLDHVMTDGSPIPSFDSEKDFIGFSDPGYKDMLAYEGWKGSGGILSSAVHDYDVDLVGEVGIEFLGKTDPSTSARFDVGPLKLFCNTNPDNDDLRMIGGGIYRTWDDATYSWDESLTAFVDYHLDAWDVEGFTSPSSTWDYAEVQSITFSANEQQWGFQSTDDGTSYQTLIVYKGSGCHKFKVYYEEV